MKLQTIVCPTDFSQSSGEAFRYAVSLAAESNAELHVLHVVDESAMYCAGYNGVGYIADVADQIEHEDFERLSRWNPIGTQVPYKTVQLVGQPAQTILKFAETVHADLIVMGSHGRTGVYRLLMGSVAEAVARAAKCPVLTVKQPADATADSSRRPGANPTEMTSP
jgi:nucleotide-binding universal stress UspA family protein